MSELNSSINPNTANAEELSRLPGVGPALAKRIIEHRPYTSLEDLTRVPGLSENGIEKMRAMIDLQPPGAPSLETPELDEGGVSEPVSRKQHTLASSEQVAFATRSQVLGISAAAAAVGVVVSMLLILSIFVGINRTLDYSRHEAFRSLATDVSQIQTQLEEIDTGMAGIDRRLEALEGLSGRMTELEGETADIASEVEAASVRVQQMRTRVEEISLQIEELMLQTEKQVSFFDRLQQLMREIFGAVVEENVQ